MFSASPRRLVMAAVVVIVSSFNMVPVLANAPAQQEEDRIRALELMVQELSRQVKEKDAKVDELQRRVDQLGGSEELNRRRTEASQQALDDMLKDIDRRTPAAAGKPGIAHVNVGGANLRLIDVSLDVMVAAGGSTATDEQLQTLQGGHHDPRKRGFTLQQAELSFFGAVDPYFNGEAHVLFVIDPLEGETRVELEEAFLTTTSLPWDLQVKAGYYLTEFGQINPRHAHAWDWLDVPVIHSRVFGPDGLRQAGARVAWLTPLPWFSELYFGVQNANGETASSFLANDEFFEERGVAGRPFEERTTKGLGDLLYSMRSMNSLEVTDELTAIVGASAVFGPNATGGDTWIYGADFTVRWRPVGHNRGWPFVTWQSEIIRRDYVADEGEIDPDGVPSSGDEVALMQEDLSDWGFYTQVLWGFVQNWAVGVRYEYATGSGDSVDPATGLLISHNDDGFRDERHRISPMLMHRFSEFSRIRLQYNYDHARHLEDDAHSVWLGFEILFGAHPAHAY